MTLPMAVRMPYVAPRGGRHESSRSGLPAAAGFAALAGSCIALFSTVPPHWPWLVSLLLLTIAAARWRHLALACCAGACCATLLLARLQVGANWPAADAGERVVAVVEVDSLPMPRGTALEFDATARIDAPARLAGRLRVRIQWRGAAGAPRAGERWQLLLRLAPPRARVNPGMFDRERALFRDRIHALGVVVDSRLNQRLAAARLGLLPLREAVAAIIRDVVVDRDASALLAGLAVGATGEMSREQWRVFGATGTTHLVAISGMHVTLFAWIAAAAARRVWPRSGRLRGVVDREPFAATIGVAAAAVYALLAGFGVPTQRTLAMLGAWWWLKTGGREHTGLEVMSLALLAVLALDPFAPLASGFWLSFCAMAVLLVGDAVAGGGAAHGVTHGVPGESPPVPRARRVREAIVTTVRTQWQVTLALAPLTILWFSSVPVAGLAVNLLAIPVFSFALVPLVLGSLAVLPLHAPLAWAGWRTAEELYLACWPALVRAADLPWASLVAEPAPVVILALVAALPWLLLPAPVPLRLAGLLALLPILFPGREPVPAGEARITVLDAGDGLAVLVETRRHALLYDTAEVHGSRGARVEGVVLPALRARRVDRLDLLVLSRSHAHRAFGAGMLLARLRVDAVRAGGAWPGAPPRVAACDVREGWQWDGVEFQLRPGRPVSASPADARGSSCVLWIRAAGGDSLLLPAQVDALEAESLGRAPGDLRATVALAPRNGSVAAITPQFVSRVAPRWLVVTGLEPGDARLAAMAQAWGLPVARVVPLSRVGALAFSLRGDGLPRLETVQASRPRWLWRRPPP